MHVMLRALFVRLKSGTEFLNYGREIIADWGGTLARTATQHPFRLLDLGCGHGLDLKNVRDAAGAGASLELHGVESYPPNVAECRQAGIRTHALDIEHDRLPAADGVFDLLVANQILEHTKEVFWIMAEAARVLKPGGHFIVGVPNLASLHNRLLLLFGQQPTPIQTYSAHVRGFTRPDFQSFAERGGFFQLRKYRGSNFYPLPPALARLLARLLPNMAWGAFFLLQRSDKQGSFLECLSGNDNFLETPFYGSPQNPAPATLRRAPRSKGKTAKSKRQAAR